MLTYTHTCMQMCGHQMRRPRVLHFVQLNVSYKTFHFESGKGLCTSWQGRLKLRGSKLSKALRPNRCMLFAFRMWLWLVFVPEGHRGRSSRFGLPFLLPEFVSNLCRASGLGVEALTKRQSKNAASAWTVRALLRVSIGPHYTDALTPQWNREH